MQIRAPGKSEANQIIFRHNEPLPANAAHPERSDQIFPRINEFYVMSPEFLKACNPGPKMLASATPQDRRLINGS
jgi:hypothetical protein